MPRFAFTGDYATGRLPTASVCWSNSLNHQQSFFNLVLRVQFHSRLANPTAPAMLLGFCLQQPFTDAVYGLIIGGQPDHAETHLARMWVASRLLAKSGFDGTAVRRRLRSGEGVASRGGWCDMPSDLLFMARRNRSAAAKFRNGFCVL